MKNTILESISAVGIVPVIKLDNIENAVPLAKALCDGGIPVAEITFRAPRADEAIKKITESVPEMIVGAGTVLTIDQADKAISAGAKFIVSPGLNPNVAAHCLEKGVPIVPGCNNPSDIEKALELGINTVKFFPAEQSGGVEMIKALSGPYGDVRFIPTGGINAKNINDYLALPKVVACGGSWMVKEDLIKSGDFAKITELASEAIKQVMGFELAHIGINAECESEASLIADSFCSIFGFAKKIGNSSIFAGSGMEVMKAPYLGKRGHIAIGTRSLKRAVYYLKQKGVEFDDNTIKYNDKGEAVAIYLKKEIGDFAVHLVEKK